jgi:hypothetical protein
MNQLSVIVFEIVSTGGPHTCAGAHTIQARKRLMAKGANPFCIGIFGIETKFLR